MKKLATAVFSLALITLASSAFAANAVRISQVYGGGGSGTAAYLNDYVELFNSSGAAIDISGWTLEYGSATGTWGSFSGNVFTFPPGSSIAPCSYLLIVGSGGAGGVALPVAADHVAGLSMSGTNGKVALFLAPEIGVACGAETPGSIVDKVAYGTANCAEGTSAPGLSSLEADIRLAGGLQDTDNNSADFSKESNFAPRNSASPANTACLATPATAKTWGQVKNIYR